MPDRRKPEVSNNKFEIGIEVGRSGQRYSADSWRYRGFHFFHACRVVLVRYEQTVDRVRWAFIRPILTPLVFTIGIGVLANLLSDGLPNPILMPAALLPWGFLSLPFRRRVTEIDPIRVELRHIDAVTRTDRALAEACFKNLSRLANAAMPFQLRRRKAVQGNMFGELPIVDALHATKRSPPISAVQVADEIHQVGETLCGAPVIFAAAHDK